MESHEKDLRSAVASDEQRQAVQQDYRYAGLTPREVALLDFAVKLTTSPAGTSRNDLDALRGHGFSDEERPKYVAGLASVIKPGGRVFLICFSDEEPGTDGPRRVSQRELRDAFAQGWMIESIEASRFEVIPDLKDMTFSPGGPKAWFAVIRRNG